MTSFFARRDFFPSRGTLFASYELLPRGITVNDGSDDDHFSIQVKRKAFVKRIRQYVLQNYVK